MEHQGTLNTTNTSNLTLTTQTLYQSTHQVQPISQTVVQDASNTALINAMEEEIGIWIVRTISYFFIALLLYVNLEYTLPLEVLFIIPILLDGFLLGYYIKKSKSSELDSNDAYYCVLEAVQNGITLLFKVSIYLRISVGDWNYSWSCFILLAALIVRIVLINSFAEESNTPSALIKTCLRIFLFALSCSVLLKLDGLSELSWTSVFWSYWIVFSVMILLCLGVVLMSCGSGFSVVSGLITINEFVVSLWLFFTVIGFTFISFAVVFNTIAFLEGNKQAAHQALSLILLYLPAFVIFTLFVYHKIPIWYLVFTKPMDLDEARLVNDRTQQNNEQEQQRDPKEIRKEQLKAKGPQQKPNFLMRLSGSYFKRMDDFAKWILGRDIQNLPAKPKDPRTQPEAKGYISFRNEGEKPPEVKFIDAASMNRQAKTERGQSMDSQRGSARYIKKTDRGGKELPTSRQGCTICLDAEANAVLMDCGHGAICFECGLSLLNSTCECHLCRQPVIQVLKIDTAFVHSDLLKVLEAADLHNIVKYNNQRDALHTANV